MQFTQIFTVNMGTDFVGKYMGRGETKEVNFVINSKINRYIAVVIILTIITLLLLSSPKIIGKIQFKNNKTIMVKYAEEKYSKEFRITYERARIRGFTTSTSNSDILNLTSDDGDAFPFEVEFENNKLKDSYPYGYMGLLIKRNIEKEIYSKVPNINSKGDRHL